MSANFLEEIAGFMLPAAIVFITVYFMLNKYFDNEQKKRQHEIKSNNLKLALPIRLQAYERLALLMERLSVNNLVLRVKKPGMGAKELQVTLLSEILSEFEHNLSQQIYVSDEAWKLISHAKEEIMWLVNVSAGSLPDTADGMALGRAILEAGMRTETRPTYDALLFIKKEVQELF